MFKEISLLGSDQYMGKPIYLADTNIFVLKKWESAILVSASVKYMGKYSDSDQNLSKYGEIAVIGQISVLGHISV